METTLPKTNFTKTLLPVIAVTLLTFSATLGAGYITKQAVNTKLGNFFAHQSDQIGSAYYERLYTHITILEGLRGFWNASRGFTQNNFSTYLKSLDLNAIDKTGVSSYFYIPAIPHANIANFEKTIQQEEGTPPLYKKFAIHPQSTQAIHYPVTYFLPVIGLEKSLGFDFAGFSERLDAINYARDENTLATTKAMTLMSTSKPGFFFLLPLYDRSLPLERLAQRQKAFIGVVGAVFSSESSFKQIFGGEDPYPLLDFQIYQGAASTPDRLLYDHDENFTAVSPRFETSRIVTLQNQTWTINIQSKPGFSLSDPEERLPIIVFVSGILATLIFAIFSAFNLAKILHSSR